MDALVVGEWLTVGALTVVGAGCIAVCVYFFVDVLRAHSVPTGIRGAFGTLFVFCGVAMLIALAALWQDFLTRADAPPACGCATCRCTDAIEILNPPTVASNPPELPPTGWIFALPEADRHGDGWLQKVEGGWVYGLADDSKWFALTQAESGEWTAEEHASAYVPPEVPSVRDVPAEDAVDLEQLP